MNILWIPHAAWRIPQRAHLFCRSLADDHTVHVTDWAADFYSWRDYLTPRYLRNFFYRLSRDGRITVHGIPRISPALFFPVLRHFNAVVFSAWVERLIRRYRIDVVVGSFVVRPPRAPRVVFDLFDDNAAYWRQGGRVPAYAKEIECVEQAYLQHADAVVAASSVLAEKAVAKTSRPVHHIPNPVNLADFQHPHDAPWRARWNVQGRIVGLLGNHDKKDELCLVMEAARQLAAENLTFIVAGRGSALPSARKEASKNGLAQMLFFPNVSIRRAADVVSGFDIGVCPYRKSPGADAGSPMRLLLYTAAGLPTVCTDLEEVKRMNFPNVVLVKDNPDAFAIGIRKALTMPRVRPPQIAAYDLPRLRSQYEAVLKGV